MMKRNEKKENYCLLISSKKEMIQKNKRKSCSKTRNKEKREWFLYLKTQPIHKTKGKENITVECVF